MFLCVVWDSFLILDCVFEAMATGLQKLSRVCD